MASNYIGIFLTSLCLFIVISAAFSEKAGLGECGDKSTWAEVPEFAPALLRCKRQLRSTSSAFNQVQPCPKYLQCNRSSWPL